MHLEEKTIKSELIYDGTVVKLYSDEAELENGVKARREVIKHPGGVCIVPLDEENNITFVKQFRYPQQKTLLEIPAGKLEFGEDHYACGVRELKEETGYTAGEMKYLGNLIPTPAYDTEIIHMYLARRLTKSEQKLDEDEFLDVMKIPFSRAVEMIMNNEINDAKTQIAILKAKILLNI